jgi:hypothetical protein
MKLLIIWSSPASHHLCPNILLSILFSNTLNLCSTISVRDQVSHPYKIKCKIMILYILIFKLFGEEKTQDFEQNCSKHSLNLMLYI